MSRGSKPPFVLISSLPIQPDLNNCPTVVCDCIATWEGQNVKKYRSAILPLFPLMLGLMSLSNALNNPRLAHTHGTDFLQLIAVGFCFGTAFGLFMAGQHFREGSKKA